MLQKARGYLHENRDDIIMMIARETGGTIIKSTIELEQTIAILDEAMTYTGELGGVKEVPSDIEGKPIRFTAFR